MAPTLSKTQSAANHLSRVPSILASMKGYDVWNQHVALCTSTEHCGLLQVGGSLQLVTVSSRGLQSA